MCATLYHIVKFADNKAEMRSENEKLILTADLEVEMFISNIESIDKVENIESDA